MEENKRLEQGFDDPGRQVLRNIIVHFTTTANNSYDVWADVVRQYLLTAYNTEEKHSAIPVAGKIYKVLKRDGVTVFYDESGQTLFDVENDRLAKEHELLSAENAAEEPVEESTEEPMEAPEEKPGEGPKSQIGKVIAGIERQAFDAAVNSGKTEDTEGKKDPIPMGTTSLAEIVAGIPAPTEEEIQKAEEENAKPVKQKAREKLEKELQSAKEREAQIEEESAGFQKILDENAGREEEAQKAVSDVQLKEAGVRQKLEFVLQNLERVNGEIRRYEEEREGFVTEAKEAKADAEKKRHDIEEIKKTILASKDNSEQLEQALKEHTARREEMSSEYKGFFQKREDISKKISDLDKEIFRLNSQREKLEEAHEYQNNYMWEEYELTLHAAMELRNEEYTDLAAMKKMIASIKDEIRKLGDVNVNAIEDYKEISERYGFLKTQHDDLVEAEKTLVGIIEELDTGMRKQFLEKFAEIQTEFDKVFKELFGGGKGTLELVEDEDILECGIRIIAQPPGKKLQNMMQMSGGEKSLTAISLLFAIQNLKPSPFCLLDEIEAALDDSNVGRFAKYLHKLTKSTQFIVITHRRGTMAAADRLYGITMQEKGVSTLVSVNLIEGDLDK